MDPLESALHAQLTRRSLLRATGGGIAGLGLASLLAACGADGGTGGLSDERIPSQIFSGQPGPTVNFANWPLYIDQEKVGGDIVQLRATAGNEYLFPSEHLLSRTSFRRQIRSEDEAEEWDNIFNPISQT